MPDRQQASFQTAVHDDFHRVNECIHEQLYSDVALVSQIGEYIIKSGGKRLRPLLVLLTARACGYNDYNHVPLAAIIEFLHTATLLHDDVVDQSDLRRGRDTANALWGNAPSVLVGDFLYSRAFQMMVGLESLKLLHILADATNVIAEGEVMQLMNINDADISEDDYMEVIRCKTAMLFRASSQTAAVLSKASPELESDMTHYGNYLGIAFQLIDDLLDYQGDTESMGKNLGDDLAEGKPTLPLIYTLKHGTNAQKALVRDAIEQGGRENIEAVVEAVRSCGALQYTAAKAREYSANAKRCLRLLPEGKYRSAMADLADFAVVRSF
ncbi:octaprenyl diphosphate synthase [Endozoicomonas sp. SCSIO W0465]|uniref:octaprenyl diphosphate synthase n=1 Tax=Endozoicomonas sp. SCSIO W0465 TaxID=2918516 RepID=UPI0020765D3D|nr:octaprenyl diphosphate synthase [Endozoicomonas sp. SCSIO W0465]USE37297.1 octaprenyl diphosphate synthase [Endozoicomonas sp. SCSIO W0465]